MIVSGGDDHRVRVSDIDGRELVELTGHAGSVWAVAPLSGGRVVSGGGDGEVRIWDLATRTTVQAYKPSEPVRAVRAVAAVEMPGQPP